MTLILKMRKPPAVRPRAFSTMLRERKEGFSPPVLNVEPTESGDESS
jgi:hypothetical protein